VSLKARRGEVALERLVEPALCRIVEAVAVAETVAVEGGVLRVRSAKAVLQKRVAMLVHIGHAVALRVLAAAAIATGGLALELRQKLVLDGLGGCRRAVAHRGASRSAI